MAKVALITGVTGQAGSYLAEALLNKGYEVHGMVRRTSSFATGRIDHLRKGYTPGSEGLQLHYGDLGDGTGLRRIIEQVRPDEVYNLAAQSHVRISIVNLVGTHLLDNPSEPGSDEVYNLAAQSHVRIS